MQMYQWFSAHCISATRLTKDETGCKMTKYHDEQLEMFYSSKLNDK